MIFDADLAREILSKNESTGRPHLEILKMRTFGELRGILFNDGASWQRQRRFALHHLRDLGMGRSTLEGIVQREVTDLVQRLRDTAGRPVAVDHFFNVNVLNVPWEIVAGIRFQPDDPRLPVILRSLSDASSRSTGLLNLIPVLLGPQLGAPIAHKLYSGVRRNRDGLVEILKLTLYSVLMDLFTASTGTNSVTLEWAVLLLLLHPECGRRARQELNSVVGPGRLVTLEDRARLPYTQALLAEVLRRSSTLALAVPHRAEADITVAGYRIPKDSRLLVNLYAIHHDPEYWVDPLEFRPDRFLHDGQYRPDKHLMPFGVGKRVCMGESLARMEQFLFLANIVHHFEVLTPAGEKAPRFDYICGTRNSPAPFRVVFRPTDAQAVNESG
ncbi:Methyl farnesoate epoxidase [Amphibalanus amphitrite]|uniref:Methyl farnesoate epoxidase n=1 Tax=Amphibalanus amphitrite TaxID=1232801 RepID=A0A6A4WSW0_AMPAM|nr:Methyl farnesoate epoxidase [Amphibalanus amphitrite]